MFIRLDVFPTVFSDQSGRVWTFVLDTSKFVFLLISSISGFVLMTEVDIFIKASVYFLKT